MNLCLKELLIPGTAAKIPDEIELEEVKAEEVSAIERSIGLSGNLAAETEFEEGGTVEIMDVDTETSK